MKKQTLKQLADECLDKMESIALKAKNNKAYIPIIYKYLKKARKIK
jgi:hypothetical protein